MTAMIDLHRVTNMQRTESALGEHWQVFCQCGHTTAYWTNPQYAVDEYGRHLIIATFDRAVDTLTRRSRERNRHTDPVSAGVTWPKKVRRVFSH